MFEYGENMEKYEILNEIEILSKSIENINSKECPDVKEVLKKLINLLESVWLGDNE